MLHYGRGDFALFLSARALADFGYTAARRAYYFILLNLRVNVARPPLPMISYVFISQCSTAIR